MQKTLFEGSPCKMPKVKTIFWLIYTLCIVIQNNKIGQRGLFFRLEAFSCKVSFYRLTLTAVIVILRLKFEVKCYC